MTVHMVPTAEYCVCVVGRIPNQASIINSGGLRGRLLVPEPWVSSLADQSYILIVARIAHHPHRHVPGLIGHA
jgi:hypothetical protein